MEGKEYLTFSARERSGIIALLLVVLMAAFAQKYFSKGQATVTIPGNLVQIRSNNGVAQKDSSFESISPEDDNVRETKYTYTRNIKNRKTKYVNKERAPFEINSADTTQFIALPGIGSKLASRIVLFREKLGGFYNVLQVREVYGLQDSVFKKIRPMLRCDPALMKKIDINSASLELLKAHPYIRWKNASAIVAYRNEHGSFGSGDDLKFIESLDSNDLTKFIPYLAYR
jgi:competence protein ComEA